MAVTDEKAPAQSLGEYLATLRSAKRMSLRDVEEATEREVSNAYLSQLENNKIAKPSPHILHALAGAYGASYENLMERAGYLGKTADSARKGRHGRVATFAIDDLTPDEESQLLKYLAFIRSQRRRK
ncbi:MAG: helix-turn-helix domain-containing protein [Alphaproteobacteria bacterium]|nr:helix-turn-helix domain-containing protein [Alphaproteobacteria bacterium]